MSLQRFSQNSWPAYETASHFTRATASCIGGNFGFWAANDDVAVVFKEFIERFDREVEEVVQSKKLDDWSYANRLVRGSTSTVSNHGSATAIDLNALKHPRGVKNTFKLAKVAALQTIRRSITDNHGVPVLRWGGDFKTTVDDMHIEIVANAARVKQAADKIRKRNEQAPPPIKDEETDMALSPADKAEIAELAAEAVWTKQRELVPSDPKDKPQTAGGLLRTIGARVDELNLETQTKDGVGKAAADPANALALAFKAMGDKLDEALQLLRDQQGEPTA